MATANLSDPDAPTTLYRFFGLTGDLLYVGISADPGLRLAQHRKDKSWWTQVATVAMEHFDRRQDAEAAEVAAIKAERPVWNVTHTERAHLPRPSRPILPLDSDPGEPCVSFKQARQLLAPLGLSEYVVRNWADAGRLKSFRLGPDGKSGHRKIALSSVLAELKKVGATPPDVPGVDLTSATPPPPPRAAE